MSRDRWIYYDFGTEQILEEYRNLEICGNSFSFDLVFECPGGESLLLFNDFRDTGTEGEYPELLFINVNGVPLDVRKESVPYFIGESRARTGVYLSLPEGKNVLHIQGTGSPEKIKDLAFSLTADPLPETEIPSAECYTYSFPEETQEFAPGIRECAIPEGFLPGIGCQQVPGRFGFTKGDGVLDGTVFTLGTFSKIYMMGHPRYKKPFLWHYSTLPEGAPRHGSMLTPATAGVEQDSVEINHLSCSWKADLEGKEFTCTYSLASPGVITEYAGEFMTLRDLEYAGNYQYAMVCRKGGKAEVFPVRELPALEMEENFILLFSTTEFPDLPLLIVLQKKPRKIEVEFNAKNHRLSRILFHNCPLMITSTPYGIESFDPVSPADEAFLRKSVSLCRFWSRALLAYPVKCEEYYRHDEENKRTEILQKFSYRYIEDDWGTLPLELAALPPAASLSGLMEAENAGDFFFPTQFGPLKGCRGAVSRYTLPWMPGERKFPLKDVQSATDLQGLFKEGFDEYFNFVNSFPPPKQSYPYAGAFLEPYAFPSALTNFLSAEDQGKLRSALSRALTFLCDGEATGDYTAISWGQLMKSNPENEQLLLIYKDPALRHYQLKLWNTRREPFTGREYTICYLNVGYFTNQLIKKGTREEIKALAVPLIENDWGLGLTFYYLYLAVLATGSLAEVKRCFEILKSAFGFFEIFHDWACMGSGYCENGVTWCEGANYGAFTAFTQLCELLEEPESLSLGRYYSSKQFALRMAIFRASRYYYAAYFGIPPYDLCQSFREGNQIYGQFLCAPGDVQEDGYRPHALYKMTTEGLYSELFEGIRKFFPEDWKRVRTLTGKSLHNTPPETPVNWGILEPAAVYLMGLSLDEDVPAEFFETELARFKERGFLMQKWRGIHIFSRRLPPNTWEVQVRAWNDMKKHPLWLTLWKNLTVLSAEWDGKNARMELSVQNRENAFIRLGYRKKPLRILLSGKEISGTYDEKEKTLQIPLSGSGTLVLQY